MDEARMEETPYGRDPATEGRFVLVLNLGAALALRNEEKGGAVYPLEREDEPFTASGSTCTSSGGASRTGTTTHSGQPAASAASQASQIAVTWRMSVPQQPPSTSSSGSRVRRAT
jgi:hypothetical protein